MLAVAKPAAFSACSVTWLQCSLALLFQMQSHLPRYQCCDLVSAWAQQMSCRHQRMFPCIKPDSGPMHFIIHVQLKTFLQRQKHCHNMPQRRPLPLQKKVLPVQCLPWCTLPSPVCTLQPLQEIPLVFCGQMSFPLKYGIPCLPCGH